MKKYCFYNYLLRDYLNISLFLFLYRLNQPGVINVFDLQLLAFLDFYLFQLYFNQAIEIIILCFYQYIYHFIHFLYLLSHYLKLVII